MADRPLKQLGGKTPLEAADIPNMDRAARDGIAGMVKTVPDGFTPASDVANMSIFGYDPAKYYSGRGPLEAANMGVKLEKNDVAFRCNLVTVMDGVMKDFTAGHISDAEAASLIKHIDENLGTKDIKFYPGVSYRHLTIIKGGPVDIKYTPPHDITGKPIEDYLPKGNGEDLIRGLMRDSVALLADHPVNKKRIQQGKSPADMIWLWGQGKAPALPLFKKKYGKTGSVITAVNLIKGIGRLIGLDVVDVPGATGYFDTNYAGKAEYAVKSLKKHDFVLVHVESPDEAGHMGNIREKIRAIENFDKFVVGGVMDSMKEDYRVMVLPDHPTPIELKTHSGDPVPFLIYGSGIKPDDIRVYNEKEVSRSKLKVAAGHKLLEKLFN